MNETQFKMKVMKHLKKKFPEAFVWKVSDKWFSGIPDIYVLHKGKSYFIELKIKGNKATKIQHHTIQQLQDAGARAGIAYNIEHVNQIMGVK